MIASQSMHPSDQQLFFSWAVHVPALRRLLVLSIYASMPICPHVQRLPLMAMLFFFFAAGGSSQLYLCIEVLAV
jgi:hypothetical protein